ncbi:hypothetical protein PIROE2DRAFT_9421 [Piromyces sp. E2]|nr:hypothetical protein PIROE2DRAFT_9421 [Piromyces sp. E2]|eukprot:OUM63959.1 hypothetical protein PIROE2DRAFT_9421 [Piromyces sp. E2]
MKGEELLDIIYNRDGELNVGIKSVIVMSPISNNDIPELERIISGFDVLIYGIEQGVSENMLNYIIQNASYRNFNYVFIENDRSFKVPLFTAIRNNNFALADRFIELGANINYIIQCDVDTIHDESAHIFPPLLGNYIFSNDHFKYYDEKVRGKEEDFIMFHLIINGNIIHYLCEENDLNEQNLTYIVNKGFNTDLIKPSLIRRLKIHNKNKYVELISRICDIHFSDEELEIYDEDEINVNFKCLHINLVKIKGSEGDENIKRDPSLLNRIKCGIKYSNDIEIDNPSNSTRIDE